MKKSIIVFALFALFSSVTAQAAVVYQFNSNLTVFIFIYSDFLYRNARGPYPTLLSDFCVTKDVSHPCQVDGRLQLAEGNGCVDDIAFCLKSYSFQEYDPKLGSTVGYHSTYRGASDYGFFTPLELFDSRVYGTTGSPAYLTISDLSSVPEPSTWVMLIAGFGFLGSTLRYRRIPVAG